MTVPPISERVAGTPVSWGVGAPGVEAIMAPERVLGEMSELGLLSTELGTVGYLPGDGAGLRSLLAAHRMSLLSGFANVVLHQPALEPTLRTVEPFARTLADAGARFLVLGPVSGDPAAPRRPLSDAEWEALFGNLAELEAFVAGLGLEAIVHPHTRTLVETPEDIARLAAGSTVRWCYDSGHVLLGGGDPVGFLAQHLGRTALVHLKDVDGAVAARLGAGDVTLPEATREGLIVPLGSGDARIGEVVAALEAGGYADVAVIEQPIHVADASPRPGQGPILAMRASMRFLRESHGRQATA